MDKNICSNCHKWLEKDKFLRSNWKNTAERYFKICNECHRRSKLKKLNYLVDKLNKDFDSKYKYISPEN